MTRLSVNLNKVALLRNARLGSSPDLLAFAEMAIAAGAPSLTVHPRADARHIRLDDVCALAAMPAIASGAVELNVEGDLRPELLRLVETVRPTQFTVVPVTPGELTSERGWRAYDDHAALKTVADAFRGAIRVAVFVDPDPRSVELAARAPVAAAEIYTGAYAQAHAEGDHAAALAAVAAAAARARALGLMVHAGHDLTTENLPPLLAAIAPEEVSIGHHLTAEALAAGWSATVARYRACVAAGGAAEG